VPEAQFHKAVFFLISRLWWAALCSLTAADARYATMSPHVADGCLLGRTLKISSSSKCVNGKYLNWPLFVNGMEAKFRLAGKIEGDHLMRGLFTMMSSRAPHVVLLLLALPLQAASQCYFPPTADDGGQPDIAQDHIPCNENTLTSMCCPNGWTCFSGGICIITDLSQYPSQLSIGAAIRASCTNPNWDQSVCGDICLSMFSSVVVILVMLS
jgi:hypothetical protein